MARGRLVLSLLTVALVAGPAFAQHAQLAPDAVAALRAQEPRRVSQALDQVAGLRANLGFDGHHSFAAKATRTDEFGFTHTHFQQHYQGVRVWQGEIVTHMDRRGVFAPHTDTLIRDLNLDVVPTLTAKEALAVAHGHLAPRVAYAYVPTTELVVLPERVLTPRAGRVRHENAEDFEYQVVRNVLAYHVHTSLRGEETRDTDYMIDAHTGAILQTWDDLHTTAAVGTGKSQFSGTVSLNTNLNGSNYELSDVVGNMPIKTYNLNHATSGTGTLYSATSNTWGDGANYVSGGSTTSANGQTAGVDAHYGIMMTSAFYKNVFNRNGINGAGKATYSSVHYSSAYDNAFWSDTCFCMTYGDGSSFKSLEALDVAGHEMSHGVCANNGLGGLTYSGESGGINEANSDIMGTFVTFYTYGAAGTGSTVPDTIATANLHGYTPWTIGSQLSSTPLRYMTKPSLDGGSADAWSSTVKNLDVHYSSGPANRMIFFLSQGATTSGNTSTTLLPTGMTGIGNDHAARIWYRALTTYFSSSMTYAQCRTACMSAASDLYGTASAEYAAVQNAFHGINVGAVAPSGTVAVALTPTTATVAAGATYQFTASVTGSTNTAVTWTTTGGTVSTAGLFTAPATAGTYTVKATSAADTTKSASATVTVTAAGSVSVALTPTTATVVAGATQQFTATVSGSTNTAVTWTATGGTVSTSGLYTAPATAGTYTVKATSAADTTKSASATVTVTTSTTTERILNGGFESGATSWTATSGIIGTFAAQPAYAGTKNMVLGGKGVTTTHTAYQSVAIPSTVNTATLSFQMHIDTAETTTATAYDKLTVVIQNSSGSTLATLATYSNLNKVATYGLKSFDVSAYKGQTIRVYFKGTEDSSLATSFVIDNVSLVTQ
jgi:Zn-dependent metalloprotease